MRLIKAIAVQLGSLDQPVVTEYELAGLIFRLYLIRSFRGEPLKPRQPYPSRPVFYRLLKDLLADGILEEDPDFPPGRVFKLLGKSAADPEDVVCAIDPFAYVSHLSAMSYHGFTDRIPSVLFISTPPPKLWSSYAKERMEKDSKGQLFAYKEQRLPTLVRTRMEKVRKHPVISYESVHHGAFTSVRGRALRVSSIGRTFLDMLREPKNCGGMRHVVDVYEAFGRQYLRLIIDELDRHGKPIEKVRAGYLLEEVVGIKEDRVAAWVQFAQRGGSRKLDPHEEYMPTFSERWCLSLNVS